MKKLILSALLLVAGFAQAKVELNETYLKVDLESKIEIPFTSYINADFYCASAGFTVQPQNIQAVRDLDALTSGFYQCSGDYARITGSNTNPLLVFNLGSCERLDEAFLKAKCNKQQK